jgi:hypothetical protein
LSLEMKFMEIRRKFWISFRIRDSKIRLSRWKLFLGKIYYCGDLFKSQKTNYDYTD